MTGLFLVTGCASRLSGKGDPGPGGRTADRGIPLGHPYREIFEPWEFPADFCDDSAGHMFQQVGRDLHLSGDRVIYLPVVQGVFERVGCRRSAQIEVCLEIHYKQVSVAALAFEAAVEAVEFHSFEFYCSVLFHFGVFWFWVLGVFVSDPSLRSG